MTHIPSKLILIFFSFFLCLSCTFYITKHIKTKINNSLKKKILSISWQPNPANSHSQTQKISNSHVQKKNFNPNTSLSNRFPYLSLNLPLSLQKLLDLSLTPWSASFTHCLHYHHNRRWFFLFFL